jgi:hypothetical protein
MIDQIIKNKPDSIFDILPEELFAMDLNTDYARSGNCWEWHYSLGKTIQPKSYLELGVRFGGSFIPTLIGAGDSLEKATGLDLETYGNNSVSEENIRKYYKGNCEWDIQHCDTQLLKELPQYYDLIMIDACHDYSAKIHDLNLTIGHAKYVWVDDASYLVDVKRAIHDWIDQNGEDGWGRGSIIEWAAYMPCFRGAYLIKYK